MHKYPIGIRPVVERRDMPTYKVEKALAKWCRQKLAGYECSLTSTRQFIDALHEVSPLPEETMEVYDFEALYPSIKLEPACILLYCMLLKNLPEEETDPGLLRNLCLVLIHEAYFQFNDSCYK